MQIFKKSRMMLRYGKTVGSNEDIFGHLKVLLEPHLLSPHSSNSGRKSRKRLRNDKGFGEIFTFSTEAIFR